MTDLSVDRSGPGAPAASGLAGQNRRPPPSFWDRLRGRDAPAPTVSPWGAIVETLPIAPGIMWFRAQERGGYWLSSRRQRALPRYLRSADGWYEDRAEWAAVAVVFARVFDRLPAGSNAPGRSLYEFGRQTLKEWWPEEFEIWFETSLDMEEIRSLPVMRFHERHADRWIVVGPAGGEIHPGGQAGRWHVRARRGGDPPYGASMGRDLCGESRRFGVDEAELHHGRGRPFLIDPDRHSGLAIADDAPASRDRLVAAARGW